MTSITGNRKSPVTTTAAAAAAVRALAPGRRNFFIYLFFYLDWSDAGPRSFRVRVRARGRRQIRKSNVPATISCDRISTRVRARDRLPTVQDRCFYLYL